MPTPRVGLIASADPSLLPFLAPRAFARSVSSQRRSCQHVGYAPIPCLQFAACRSVTTTPSSRAASTSTSTCASASYIAISHFARHHVRCYSSDISDSPRDQALDEGFAASTRSGTERLRARPDTRQALLAHSSLARSLAVKRNELMDLTHARFRGFMSEHSGVDYAVLFQSGQYRSLRRRLLELRHWDATQFDVEQSIGGQPTHSHVIAAFSALSRSVFESSQLMRRISIIHNPFCVRWIRDVLATNPTPSLADWSAKWLQFSSDERSLYALPVLLCLLHRKPGLALDFLPLLAGESLDKTILHAIAADALGYLARIHLRGVYLPHEGWQGDREATILRFGSAFLHFYESHWSASDRREWLSNDAFTAFFKIADADHAETLLEHLVERNSNAFFRTFLHAAQQVGKAGRVQPALRCLKHVRAHHFPSGDNQLPYWFNDFRSICAQLLRKSMSKAQNYHDTPELVAEIVAMGIKMDITLYNAVMHNAMDAGDYSTAFKVYGTLEQVGVTPDAYTFSILIHGCASQSDPPMFNDFAELCAEMAMETKNDYVASTWLHYQYTCHHKDTDLERATSIMWRSYLRFFSGVPLLPFISHGRRELRHAITKQQTHARASPFDVVLMQPPSVVLYLMLQVEIRVASAASNQSLWQLYEQFRRLATEATHSSFMELGKEPIIWNAFLYAFCTNQQFDSASNLLKDMMEVSINPNVYSWSILMQAFFKTDQVQAAERVIDIMRSRGVELTQYTYGVMVRGYAKSQLIDRVGAAMVNLEDSYEMNPDLMNFLAGIGDRTQLMLELEKSRLRKEANMKEAAMNRLTNTAVHKIDEAAFSRADTSNTSPRFKSMIPKRLRRLPKLRKRSV